MRRLRTKRWKVGSSVSVNLEVQLARAACGEFISQTQIVKVQNWFLGVHSSLNIGDDPSTGIRFRQMEGSGAVNNTFRLGSLWRVELGQLPLYDRLCAVGAEIDTFDVQLFPNRTRALE